MSEIQGGRWDALLRRLFPVKGPSISPTISPEIQPVVVVQPFGADMYSLKGERRFASYFSHTGSSGNACAYLENPEGSNLLLIVDWVNVFAPVTQDHWLLGWATNFGTNDAQINSYPLDSRYITSTPSGSANTSGARCYETDTAPSSGVYFAIFAADRPFNDRTVTIPIVVKPGMKLVVRDGASNHRIDGTMVWREQPASQAELNLGQ